MHHRAEGPAGAPPLLLGPSLGTSLALWDGVVPELAVSHRVVRWDLPGHGGSDAALIGPGATVADLARLVLALADSLALERFAYAGVSLGGAVGLHLATHAPERISSLAVICSSAHFGARGPWEERAALARREGMAGIARASPSRWFTPGFTVAALVDDVRGADPAGYAACCEALGAYDIRDLLPTVTAPTLVVAGREDPAAPPAHSREIADGVPGAALVELPGAAHLAPAERPEAVTAALRAHLGGAPPSGERVRREVLGDAHVARTEAGTTAFTARFHDFVSRCAWGEIWTDPTLPRRERHLIALTALVAQGHHDELATQVRAAVRGGLTPDEIGAALLQSAVYCGVPAARSAFAVAGRVLAEDGPAG
ncbi:3-oxoadipate enol-lactonase, partial [Streptomyces sp. NPDC059142]|uniref:bifunctional 3-oxoadipate enol-lactonase/4-carboxymuconolactone decarboxylase PcaDC n=1 Tax=Streptomyces sp. NPDC059142 TaxID=3346739 RepID=UPI0036AA7757